MTSANALPDLLIGSYTADSNGQGEGISIAASAPDGSLAAPRLAAATDSPSFIAMHPALPVVYAVGETAQLLSAFRRAHDGALTPLGAAWPAGEAVCHVVVDPLGRFAVTACWGDGQVIGYDLDTQTGAILSRRVAAPAVDPYADADPYAASPAEAAPRQSRAHASLFLPDGRIMTTDLGFDLARVWRWQPGGGLVLDHEVTLPLGSGPRHLALHPAGQVYIVTEYSIQVLVLTADASGRFSLSSVAEVFAGGAHDGDSAAHISLDEAARHVHVTVRGANRVAVLQVRDGGVRLDAVADVPCGGDLPRHHLQRDGCIHVANQRSGDIATFRLDPATGIPSGSPQVLPTGSPTCLVPLAD
ncbi:MAG TPA: beta-propeller fold lactonase family protein [Humibacter sp.]|nr:beta-propeller fold lactonase family protein [Humibacter sp.]